MTRGYFGIGIYQPKSTENIGTLWRSAHAFGANYMFTIGARYRRQPTDTTHAALHVPLYEFDSFEMFQNHTPLGCELVCIEISDRAHTLPAANHPTRAVYMLGSEDHGLPESIMSGNQVITIPTQFCLNVAVAGSIVLYDRVAKQAVTR